jgi:hypothetical protein
MDKDEILTFLKKNAFALSCGVVALGAVVATFYPFGGMVDDLQKKATEETSSYGRINSLLHPRTLPQVDPARTTPVDLTAFPNAEQLKIGQAAIAKLTTESLDAMAYLVQINGPTVHPPLTPGVFPAPINDTPKFTFADVYKRVLSTDPTESGLGSPSVLPPVQANPGTSAIVPVDPMPVDDHLTAVKAVNLCNDVLIAGTPPNPKLVADRIKWLSENVYQPQITMIGGKPEPVTKAEVDRKFTAASLLVPDQLAREIAAKKKVYLDPTAFAPNPSLLTDGNHPMTDIWFGQLSLWVQTDVANAVAQLNLDAKDVAASPVKRILRLEMRPGQAMYQFPYNPAGGAVGAPSAADEKQPLPADFNLSPTGRSSNGMYDVIPFRLVIDVDANRVNDVLDGLTHRKLIYIYNQDLYTLDPTSLAAQGYLYGPVPIVRLSLSGEELFLRQWTSKVMPERIKQMLAGQVIVQTGGGGMGGPGGNPMMPQGGPRGPND